MEKAYVNARFLSQRKSGVQNYALNLSLTLKEMGAPVIFVTCREVIQHEEAAKLDALVIGRMKSHVWEQFELVQYLKKQGNPLLINFCNTAPLNYSNQFNTIHDLAFEKPEPWFSPRFRYFYRWLIPQVARNCRQLFTVSDFSAGEISVQYGIAKDRILIMPNTVSAEMEGFLKEPPFGSDEKYFLTVGSLDPRKNISSVIAAFISLNLTDVRLKIAGRRNRIFSSEGNASLYSDHPMVDWVEDANNRQLVELYRNAIASVNLSFYEGFGLTNLEAMACGCPVIASDISVFREVCGPAAIYVNPSDEREAAAAMQSLMVEKDKRQTMKLAGAERASVFTTAWAIEPLAALLRQKDQAENKPDSAG